MHFLWLSQASHSLLKRVMDHLGIACSRHPLCFDDIRHTASYIESLKGKHLPREPATALPFNKIRYRSPPVTAAANFHWTVTVARHFCEHISSINSVNPLSSPSKTILLLLPFSRWVSWGTEDWIMCSSSHREIEIVSQAIWHQIPYLERFSISHWPPLPWHHLLVFTYNLCSNQSGLLFSSPTTFLSFQF